MLMVMLMHVVYGGSFNPPTKAHLEVYEHLSEHLDITRFTFLPVGSVYGKRDLESDEHRYRMLETMVANKQDVVVSGLEMEDPRFKGTYRALKRLRRGQEPLAFVIGADNLLGLYRWKNINKLLDEFHFIVLNRGESDLDQVIEKNPFLRYHRESFILFPDFSIPVSSSTFRKTKDRSLLPKEVADYIDEQDLYKE